MKRICALLLTLLIVGPMCEAGDHPTFDLLCSPIVRKASGKINKPYTVFTIAAITANSMDYASTRYAMSRGAVEANPGMAPFYTHEPAAVGYKLGLINLGLIMTAKKANLLTGKMRIIGYIVLSVDAGLFTYATVHNIRVAQSMR